MSTIHSELYVMGRLFRILMDASRERGANRAELENATHNPMAAIGTAYTRLIKLHKLTPDLERKIFALLEPIEPDDMNFNTSPSLEMQSSFMVGYEIGDHGLFKISKISERRKAADMTQSELAQKIGVSQKDISRWENGVVNPSTNSLKQLAIALNCKVDDIV